MLTVLSQRTVISVCFILAAFLLLPTADKSEAALPAALKSTQLDWVCVTDTPLVEAYETLAEYRRAQGLSAIVLPLSEVIRWSPTSDDTTATLRWLAGVAYQQWGTEYLLIGGSHDLLPSPIHRLSFNDLNYDHPTDAYYACLDGQWDVDGDGLVAEWEEDAADPTPHLMVGRLPADDAGTVTDVVAKIMAFENRDEDVEGGALFVSSHMLAPYQVLPQAPGWALSQAESLRDSSLARDPQLRAGTLYQGLRDQYNPLYEQALLDSLGARAHDFVYCQLQGTEAAWDLGEPPYLTAQAFEPLRDVGHSFLLSMISGEVADTRSPGIIQQLINLRGGGAVAAIAPSGLGYYIGNIQLQKQLWPRLIDRNSERVGDVHAAARAAFVADPGLMNFANATSYWYLTLYGDPATLIRPVTQAVADLPVAASVTHVRATPNPFNPHTEIAFEVAGQSDQLAKVVVEIFDLQGRRVTTLLDAALPSGPQSVRWYAKSASGLYFARVTVNDNTETIKLMLAK